MKAEDPCTGFRTVGALLVLSKASRKLATKGLKPTKGPRQGP